MKIFFILLIFITFTHCEEAVTPENKIFDAQKLSSLSLNEVNTFWVDDSIKNVSDDMGTLFDSHAGFIKGIRYGGNTKIIAVSVFNSQSSAIEAMDLRRNNVASIILEGKDHNIIKDKWWFTEGIPKGVLSNQWNTIIEVSCYNTDYEEVKAELMNTAAEIARRIEMQSN